MGGGVDPHRLSFNAKGPLSLVCSQDVLKIFFFLIKNVQNTVSYEELLQSMKTRSEKAKPVPVVLEGREG